MSNAVYIVTSMSNKLRVTDLVFRLLANDDKHGAVLGYHAVLDENTNPIVNFLPHFLLILRSPPECKKVYWSWKYMI